MSEQFGFNSPEVKKEAPLPEDFPIYPKNYQFDASTREGMPDDDKQMFFDNKGDLDKDLTTRVWYAISHGTRINKPSGLSVEDHKNIELNGFLGLKEISFDEYFKKSGAYRTMACLPESDPERKTLLDFQADLVMHSFSSTVRKIVDSIPELKESAERFVKAKIKYDADRLRREVVDSLNKESDDKLSESLKEEYLEAEKEFDRIRAEQNIKY